MKTDLLKLSLSSGIYSFTPLIEKIILKTLTKDVYILIKYTIRFISVVGFNLFSNTLSIKENLTKIKSVLILLIIAAGIAFSSQYLYFDVLKNMDVSLIEPIGSIIINICSLIVGWYFLGEHLTFKKMLGVGIGGISIFLLTG